MSKKVRIDPIDLPWYVVTWHYTKALIGAFVVFLVLRFFWGDDMLVNFDQLTEKGFVPAGLGKVWFIFVWALAVPLVVVLVFRRRSVSDHPREAQVGRGLWLSLNAGVFEELIYRWLIFVNAMVLLRFFNFITFGFVKFFYTHALIPLADFTTFHALHPYLLHDGSWVFGAAIVSAAARFRSEHAYLGFLGWVNSWFMGMLLFYLMFNYGLATAIVAHFLYDAIIFTFRGLTSEKPQYRFRIRMSYN